MHREILVLADEPHCPYAAEMASWLSQVIHRMDWMPSCHIVPAGLQESIASFNEAYGLDVQTLTLDIDGGAQEVGILDRGCLQSLMEALRKNKEERLENVRKELEKPDPSMWQVAHNAYLDNSFYFVTVLGDGTSTCFYNEMDFYESIEIEDAPLYLVGTYNFHV